MVKIDFNYDDKLKEIFEKAQKEIQEEERNQRTRRMFKEFAHTHTKAETEKWLNDQNLNLDIMYNKKGRPICYDIFNGECAGIRCTDGYLWN